MVGAFHPHIMSRWYAKPAHNSLVQNSAVPILLVPPQMMLSETLSMSYIPQRIGKHCQARRCEKCGTSHAGPYDCPAINRKCYHCRRYGHYADFCLSRKPSSQEQQNMVNITNSEVQTDASISVVSNVVSDTVQHLVEVSNEESSCKPNEEVLELQSKCAELETRNLELSEKIEHLQSTLHETEQNSEHLKSQLRKAFEVCVGLNGSCAEFDHLIFHLVDEFNTVAFMTAEKGINENQCRRCFTFSHLTGDTCPALGHFCSRCGKSNHFNAACETENIPAYVFDKATMKFLKSLEKTTGITMDIKINCLDCDQ